MGQEFSSPNYGIQSLIHELPDFDYEKRFRRLTSLGNSRYLKTIQCTHPQGNFIVKVYTKSQPESLAEYQYKLLAERDQLKGIPNILAYDMVIETERAGFAIRQYIQSSLYDRISTRPFLSLIEKKWIAYQLLTAISEAHSRFIYHGDIKTENVMVTSWNWVYLADFASFKPVILPDDNPTKFSLFFDASSRRTCYVAPERFKSTEDKLFESVGQLTPEMDVFSLGCTIAEMFLEGSPLFTLSQLLQYRKGEYDPGQTLLKIEDVQVRTMILDMIALNSQQRQSSKEILNKYRSTVFPEGFYTILHHFVGSLTDLDTASNICANHAFISSAATPMVTDADYRIEQIYHDFAILAKVCGIEMKQSQANHQNLFPVVLNIPNLVGSCEDLVFQKEHSDLALIVASLLCSNVRNCLYPTSKQRAVDMLLVLGLQLRDEFKLDRIVPYFVSLLSDPYPVVKINALVALTQLLSSVDSITPSDSNIFPEYIIPSLKQFVTHRNPMIRSTYAQCIATIAETSLLFLEMFEVLKDDPQFEIDTDTLLFNVSFDANLRDLHELVQEDVVVLLTDVHPLVRRALLADMSRLCIFFGKQKSNDFLISHIITYLNDPDWALRAAFCEAIVGIGTFVGQQSLEQFILPMLIMALTDAQEFVVVNVLNSLSSLVELGLIQKPKLKELASVVAPLLCHPNRWIVYGSVGFLANVAKILPMIDIKCLIYPLVKPFLKNDCVIFTEATLIENLKSPIKREMYEYTIEYAIKEERNQTKIGNLDKDEQDLLSRLREMGLSPEDKEKLVELKYYVSKTAKARQRSQISSTQVIPDFDYIALRDQNVIPHTVFLTPPSFVSVTMPEESYSSRASSPRLTTAPSSPRKFEDFTETRKPPLTNQPHLAPTRQLSRTSLGGLELPSEASRASPNSIQRMSGFSAISARSRNASVNELSSMIIEGEEKHIRELLEKKRYDLAQPVIPELGPKVKIIANSYSQQQEQWSPKGVLVAQFPEHRGCVNAIEMAPDHKFFASCSDDGTVKIWDTDRLLTNVTNRARLTYNGHGTSPVKALGFIEGRHSIVSASKDGKVHISRIEYLSRPQQSTKYTNCKFMNRLTLVDDYATHVSHQETEYSSLLVYATKKGILSAVDIRSMKEAWTFTPPPHYGEITSMVMDKNHSWLFCGTHRGVLSLWDVRFGVNTNSWQHPSKSAISKLSLYPLAPQGKPHMNNKTICMAVDNGVQEISVWDVETRECHQVWCVLGEEGADSESKLNSMYGNGLGPLPPPSSADLLQERMMKSSGYTIPQRPDRRVFSINQPHKCMISGGTDKILRYHDISFPEKSFVVSGPATSSVYNSHHYHNVYFNIEHIPKHQYQTPKAGEIGGLVSSVPIAHLDAITAIAVTNKPSTMVISGSRNGIINVYQ